MALKQERETENFIYHACGRKKAFQAKQCKAINGKKINKVICNKTF
jgi:hypothetical protein